jgi:L-asparaginase II
VPGLVAKDGAEGVFAAALPDGRAVAVKIADGAPRPVPTVVAAALAVLAVPVPEEVGRVDVLGHGEPVGAVHPVLGSL